MLEGYQSYVVPGGNFFSIPHEDASHKQKMVGTLSLLSLLTKANTAQSHTYFSDSLITLSKTQNFLREDRFAECAKVNQDDPVHNSILWRTHVLCWAAMSTLHLPGDFVELGCYNGKTARFIYDYVGLEGTNKQYFLYDLFGGPEGSGLPDHQQGDLLQLVRDRFAGDENVHVIPGEVPEVLKHIAPEKISFMHLDMNCCAAEIGALESLFDRVVPGGIIILDDYGWLGYQEQMVEELRFMRERGHMILELPTGQGLVLRH